MGGHFLNIIGGMLRGAECVCAFVGTTRFIQFRFPSPNVLRSFRIQEREVTTVSLSTVLSYSVSFFFFLALIVLLQ